tara:strand:+ start:171 stop:686 length:516 start_codon:yes stop_codon:yes gene_type:complete
MIKFKLNEGVSLPQYATQGDVGMDITAQSILAVFQGDKEVTGDKLEKIKAGFERAGYIKLRSLERMLFGSGVFAELPDNLELQVRSRSGMAAKKGLVVANSPGTIDPGYRGEIGVILFNSTPFLNEVKKGDRIAQLVPKEVIRPKSVEVSSEEFNDGTERGSSGFGSTGER